MDLDEIIKLVVFILVFVLPALSKKKAGPKVQKRPAPRPVVAPEPAPSAPPPRFEKKRRDSKSRAPKAAVPAPPPYPTPSRKPAFAFRPTKIEAPATSFDVGDAPRTGARSTAVRALLNDRSTARRAMVILEVLGRPLSERPFDSETRFQ